MMAAAFILTSCNDDEDPGSGSTPTPVTPTPDNSFYIKFTKGGTNYNYSTSGDSWYTATGLGGSIGDPISCRSYDCSIYHDDGDLDGISPTIAFNYNCVANSDWDTQAFFDIFQEMTYDYSTDENDQGAGFSLYDYELDEGARSWEIAQPGTSSFIVTDVTETTPTPFGNPYVIVKGTFNCKVSDGSVITNGSFRVIIEKL